MSAYPTATVVGVPQIRVLISTFSDRMEFQYRSKTEKTPTQSTPDIKLPTLKLEKDLT